MKCSNYFSPRRLASSFPLSQSSSNLSSYSFHKTFPKPVMRTLVLSFLPSVIYMWTTAGKTRSKWRESKVNMYKQASSTYVQSACMEKCERRSKKKQSSQRRNAKEVKYAATIDCHFLVCLFVGLLMCRKIKANDSCARRYITSQQINWLKLKQRVEEDEIFPFIYSLPFEVFFFGKQIMQHAHWIVTHKHNWVSSTWMLMIVKPSLKGRLQRSLSLTWKST